MTRGAWGGFVVALWCGVASAGNVDSTSVDPFDVTDIEAALESGVTGDVEQVVADVTDPGTAHSSGGASLALDIVGGYRLSRRVRATMGPASASARWTPLAWAGSAGVRRIGIIENIVVGGVRARFGEGILLGAAPSAYGAPRRSLRPAAVDATTSLWDQRRGAGIVLRVGSTRGGVFGWESVGRQARWCFAERTLGRTTLAGAVGRMNDVHGQRAFATSIALARVFDGGLAACEIASIAGSMLASVRVVSGDDWSAEMFSVASPGGFGAAVLEPEDTVRRQVGAAVHRGLARGRVSLYSVRRRRDGDDSLRRRIEWRTRHPVERIDLILRLTDDVASTRTRDSVDPAATHDHVRTALGRLRATFAIAPGIDTGCTLSAERALVGERSGGIGVVAAWMLDVRRRFFDARMVASSFDLAAGQLGYVARAGIGGYETASVVSRQGGEVSFRAGLNYRGVRVSVFAGRPHGVPARALVALNIAI